MTWFLAVAGLAVLAGLAYGAYRLVSWESLGGLAVAIFKALLPVILKRKTLEEEAKDRERWRQGIPPGQNRHER